MVDFGGLLSALVVMVDCSGKTWIWNSGGIIYTSPPVPIVAILVAAIHLAHARSDATAVVRLKVAKLSLPLAHVA